MKAWVVMDRKRICAIGRTRREAIDKFLCGDGGPCWGNCVLAGYRVVRVRIEEIKPNEN